MSPESVTKRVNSMLPGDVTIHGVWRASDAFHSRYDAKSKVYRYRVIEGRSPLRRNQAWEVRYDLNPDWMNASAQYLVGEKDLSSFTVEPKEDNVVRLSRARWKKTDDELHFEVEANRFLHKMVRMMAGRMVEIGRGRWPPDTMEGLLTTRKKGTATPTAPPHGLCLVEVKY
jgi:tRNA pseudouridine38-40 synthase